MTDRTRQDRRLLIAMTALMVIVVVLGVVALVAQLDARRATDAMRKSATYASCRAQVVNDAEDEFRHAIGNIFDASLRDDREQIEAITDAINSAPRVNDEVARRCPEPLASVAPTP